MFRFVEPRWQRPKARDNCFHLARTNGSSVTSSGACVSWQSSASGDAALMREPRLFVIGGGGDHVTLSIIFVFIKQWCERRVEWWDSEPLFLLLSFHSLFLSLSFHIYSHFDIRCCGNAWLLNQRRFIIDWFTLSSMGYTRILWEFWKSDRFLDQSDHRLMFLSKPNILPRWVLFYVFQGKGTTKTRKRIPPVPSCPKKTTTTTKQQQQQNQQRTNN